MRIGIFSLTQSSNSHGYHLYMDVEKDVVINGKKTGEKYIKPKRIGYDMPLDAIMKRIAEHESFEETKPLYNRFISAIEEKLEDVGKRIITELKNHKK